jgi:hypothetical protein
MNQIHDALCDQCEKEGTPDKVPPLEDFEVEIRGRRFRLGDIATITITADSEVWDALEDDSQYGTAN